VIGVAMLNLSSTRQMLAAISQARAIDAEAYTLHGPVLRALEEAARDGAHVVVRLEGRPYGDRAGNLARENRRLVGELQRAGATAQLGHPLHAKAIAVDSTLYLDDQNWGMHDLVLRDDDPSGLASIPSIKHAALAAEAHLLRGARAGDRIIVESESFGCCNPVYSALDLLGRAGAAPRLLVCANELRANARERKALERLAGDGVRVRICSDSEKLAVAGDRAWCGSANATVAFGESDMPDWGVTTEDGAIVGAARGRLEAQWGKAKDFKPK
jgi:hypothetical protein